MAASVAKHDLGGVLVGHHDTRFREATSVGKRVVGLEGLLNHAGVQGRSHFEDITKQSIISVTYSNKFLTYWASEVVSEDFIALRSTFLGI